jgi:hypothetical protein
MLGRRSNVFKMTSARVTARTVPVACPPRLVDLFDWADGVDFVDWVEPRDLLDGLRSTLRIVIAMNIVVLTRILPECPADVKHRFAAVFI